MTIQYWSLLDCVAPIFAMIAAGFLMRRLGWLTPAADQSLLRVAVNLLLPALVLDSMLGNPALQNIRTVLLAPVIGVFTVFLGFAACLLGARFLKMDDRQRRTFAFVNGIYNYGYIPIPIVQSLFTHETMGVLFTFNLGVETTFWTAGILLLTGASRRNALNAPVIAIIASLLLNFSHLYPFIPHFLLTTAKLLGQSSIPLALILTGATLADTLSATGLRGGLRFSVAACALRLGLLPVLFLLIAKFVPCSTELKQVLVIQAAMPAAMLPIVITRLYGGDSDVALHVVLSTTVVALLTIPFWIKFGMVFVGL